MFSPDGVEGSIDLVWVVSNIDLVLLEYLPRMNYFHNFHNFHYRNCTHFSLKVKTHFVFTATFLSITHSLYVPDDSQADTLLPLAIYV